MHFSSHIKGLLDKSLGCARLLTPAETLYGVSDKFMRLQEEFFRETRFMKSNNVNTWAAQALMNGEEQQTERDGRGKETGTQGRVRLPAVGLIEKVISKVTCHGGSGQASHKADKEQ